MKQYRKGEKFMATKTLVIMAAGMGSRYGGNKQIDPMGPNGEIILEYSIYDALKAGFDKVVFIINKAIENAFRENIGYRIEKLVETAYVYQSVHDIPAGFTVPEGRVKPWGTGHAVLLCKDVVNTPFAVINADDFYGADSFNALGNCLGSMVDTEEQYSCCMVGFKLENTLTENGHVSRGVCSVTPERYLAGIQERKKIQKFGSAAKYTEDGETWITIPPGSTVSMNMWGFTPSLFGELERSFHTFLQNSADNAVTAEFYLPSAVDSLIAAGKARIGVLTTNEKWYGVTYKEDRPVVIEAIRKMHEQGVYPNRLWKD